MSPLKKILIIGAIGISALVGSNIFINQNQYPQKEEIFVPDKTEEISSHKNDSDRDYVKETKKTEIVLPRKKTNKITPEIELYNLEDLAEYYFRCSYSKRYTLKEQGEILLSSENDFESRWNENHKICTPRAANYLSYLLTQEDFLERTYQFANFLLRDNFSDSYFLDGLMEIGGEKAAWVLLNIPPLFYHCTWYKGGKQAENFILAQKLIDRGDISKRDARDFYLSIFYHRPSVYGIKFILDNSDKNEKEDFLSELFFMLGEDYFNLFLDGGYQELPEETLKKIYAQADDFKTKLKILGQIGLEHSHEELEKVYQDANLIEKAKLIEILKKKDGYFAELFLSPLMEKSQDDLEIIVLGDSILDHILNHYQDETSQKYFLIKAKAESDGEDYEIGGNIECGSYCDGASVHCTINPRTEKIECRENPGYPD